MKKIKKSDIIKTTRGRQGWHSAITGKKAPNGDVRRRCQMSNFRIVFDFYCKQWHILGEFENKLNAELLRYAKQPQKARKKFIFQLDTDTPISLEELPILWLKLKEKPSYYALRFAAYSKKGRVDILKKLEYFLKFLGLKPLPMPAEVKKILFQWKRDIQEEEEED